MPREKKREGKETPNPSHREKKLVADEEQVTEELKAHLASGHADTPLLTATPPAAEAHPNLEEEVRHRAYELYEQRGRQDGRDLDDWLQAEAEVTGTVAKDTAA